MAIKSSVHKNYVCKNVVLIVNALKKMAHVKMQGLSIAKTPVSTDAVQIRMNVGHMTIATQP